MDKKMTQPVYIPASNGTYRSRLAELIDALPSRDSTAPDNIAYQAGREKAHKWAGAVYYQNEESRDICVHYLELCDEPYEIEGNLIMTSCCGYWVIWGIIPLPDIRDAWEPAD